MCVRVCVSAWDSADGWPASDLGGHASDNNLLLIKSAALLLDAFMRCVPFCVDFSNASETTGNSPSLTGHLLPMALTTASATLHAQSSMSQVCSQAAL